MNRKKLKKKRIENKPDSGSAKKPPSNKEPEIPEIYSGPDKEVRAMLMRIHEMKNDLEKKLTNIYEKAALSKIDIEEFLDNSDNFTKKEWDRIQKNKDALIQNLSLVFTPEDTVRKQPKSKEKLAKERRGKTLGVRKKWIPVR